MKYIYELVAYAKHGKDDWLHMTEDPYWRYVDVREDETQVSLDFSTYDETLEYLQEHKLASVRLEHTWFTDHPVIRYRDDYGLWGEKVTKRSFKPINEKWVYEKVDDYSFKELMEKLRAKDFIEYCKDNGLKFLCNGGNE